MPIVLSILFNPSRSFMRLREHPRWLGTFLFLTTLSVAVLIIVHSHTVRATLEHLPTSATTGDRAMVETMLWGELPSRSLFQPIRLIIGWSGFAGVLFLLSKAFRPPLPVSFPLIFALEVHAETILLLSDIGLCLHIVLQGPGLPSVYPLWSADYFASPATLPMIHSLLRSINIFTLWYAAILAAGIRVLCGLSIFKSVLVAASAFALSVLFDFGILSLLISAVHLQV
jgi:hypothetical protein